jgi:MraZ protein
LEHAVLYGEYELVTDVKSRLLVPSEIRRQLDPQRDGSAFFLIPGLNQHLWLYPDRYYERLAGQTPTDDLPADAVLDHIHASFGLAKRLEMDSQGRLLIPDKVLRKAGLNAEMTLVGALNHLELWNRDDWDQRKEALIARAGEIAQKAKEARKTAKEGRQVG